MTALPLKDTQNNSEKHEDVQKQEKNMLHNPSDETKNSGDKIAVKSKCNKAILKQLCGENNCMGKLLEYLENIASKNDGKEPVLAIVGNNHSCTGKTPASIWFS